MSEKVFDILSEFSGIDKNEIKEDSNLIYDLGLSSLDMVEIVVRFEEEFDIQIEDDAVANFHTVKDILNFLLSNE